MPLYVYVIIAMVVIIIVQVIRMSHRASSHHFECTGCGTQFRVSAGRYMFTAHSFDGKCQVTCPACGKTGMMRPLAGKVTDSTDGAGGTDGAAS